jgi:hypothetical protein
MDTGRALHEVIDVRLHQLRCLSFLGDRPNPLDLDREVRLSRWLGRRAGTRWASIVDLASCDLTLPLITIAFGSTLIQCLQL